MRKLLAKNGDEISVKKSFTMKNLRPYLQSYRPISKRLPLWYQFATPPRPDPGHLISSIMGVSKRVAVETPKPNRKLRRRFKRFVKLWLRRHFKPLEDDEILDFEEWMSTTSYSEKRKVELIKLFDECGRNPTVQMLEKVKAFIKDETYPDYKFPRGIYSRSDYAKCLFGPLVASVSAKLFDSKWFIKKIPVVDRPRAIYDRLYRPGANYLYTDYTAFESHFTKDLMEDCENVMFKFFFSKTKLNEKQVKLFADIKCGIQKIVFKMFDFTQEAGRMSGEMDTSTSNGFANLMLFLFACDEQARREGKSFDWDKDCEIFVEGDDGIAVVLNGMPEPTAELFAELGMTIDIGRTKELNTASFCGQVYDVEDGIVVTDIREQVARLGWTNKQYVNSSRAVCRELLRARGYSLVYQYGRCPVLGVLGAKILQLTSNVQVRQSIIDHMDEWERTRFLQAMEAIKRVEFPEELVSPPGANTRCMVERLYNVPVSEQLEIEASISRMTELGPLPFQFSCVPDAWIDYYEKYSSSCKDSEPVWLREEVRLCVKEMVRSGAIVKPKHRQQLLWGSS